MFRTAWFWLTVLLTTAAWSAPALYWASDPVRPDETLLLAGDGLAADAVVEVAPLAAGPAERPGRPATPITGWTVLPTLQGGPQAAKVVLPAEWQPGLYAARVRVGAATSDTWLVNAPDPFWTQGDEGRTASRGGWLRVFGKCLGFGPARVCLRSAAGDETLIEPTEATCWQLTVALPASVEPGNYTLFVHNGWGGPAGWRAAGPVTIRPPVDWKTDLFTIDLAAAKGDATKAIRAALAQAKANGGGIVHLPRGSYDIDGALEIPPGTILRGAAMAEVVLYWKNSPAPPPAWITGANYGVQDLTIYCLNYQRVIADTPDSERFRLSHVRVRAVPEATRAAVKSTVDTKAALHLQGRNFSVTDCDLYCRMPGFGEGRVVLTGPWGFAAGQGPYYGVIRGCTLRGGLWGCENLKGMIFEHNRVDGVCCSSTTYWNNFSQDAYVAHNEVQHVYGGDREIMTFDAGGQAYFGRAKAAGTHLTLAADPVFRDYAPRPHTDYRGAVVYILDGRGAGQYRFVTANSGREWDVDRAWIVPPDETSVLSIVPFRGHNLFIGNTFTDGGAVQLYGSAADVIVAENKGARIDGFFTWGLNQHGWGWHPAWYCQFLDNELVEPSGYGGRVWGPAFFGATTSDSNADYSGPLARGNVFRRNALRNQAYVRVGGQTVDTLVEKNVIQHSPKGVVIDPSVRRTLLRRNQFDDVAEPQHGGEPAVN